MRPPASRRTNTLCSTPVLIDALGIEDRIAPAADEGAETPGIQLPELRLFDGRLAQ